MDGSKRKVCSVLLLVTLGRNRWGKSPLVFLGFAGGASHFCQALARANYTDVRAVCLAAEQTPCDVVLVLFLNYDVCLSMQRPDRNVDRRGSAQGQEKYKFAANLFCKGYFPKFPHSSSGTSFSISQIILVL